MFSAIVNVIIVKTGDQIFIMEGIEFYADCHH